MSLKQTLLVAKSRERMIKPCSSACHVMRNHTRSLLCAPSPPSPSSSPREGKSVAWRICLRRTGKVRESGGKWISQRSTTEESGGSNNTRAHVGPASCGSAFRLRSTCRTTAHGVWQLWGTCNSGAKFGAVWRGAKCTRRTSRPQQQQQQQQHVSTQWPAQGLKTIVTSRLR